jgi:hypothetical protein
LRNDGVAERLDDEAGSRLPFAMADINAVASQPGG